ncbi:hypothetical protein AALB51_19705 [Lachnospiraceae bacterium 62-26]
MTNIARTYNIILVRAIFGGDEMSPAGRPKIDNPKNVRLEIRLTKDENRLLEECASKMRVTKTEVIKEGVQLVKAKLDEK